MVAQLVSRLSPWSLLTPWRVVVGVKSMRGWCEVGAEVLRRFASAGCARLGRPEGVNMETATQCVLLGYLIACRRRVGVVQPRFTVVAWECLRMKSEVGNAKA